MNSNQVIYITGVSGSGKTTVGLAVSQALNIPYFDADDFHPETNVRKMEQGLPLNDKDREGWLVNIQQFALERLKEDSLIIGCSALKEKYRRVLSNGIENKVHWVFLNGNYDLILQRMKDRKGHFMPPELLRSQFEILEIPKNALEVDISRPFSEIVISIKAYLMV